ncbi:hypothetical protein BH11MYX1_BH11MYX1_54980 [soil metagenome]
MILASWPARSDAFELPATRLASGRSGHGILPLVTRMSALRSLRAVVVLAAVAACGDSDPIRANDVGESRELVAVPIVSNNKLDLLFVLDNKASIDHQISLTDAFPALLAQLSAGGRPDLHVGAITPDMGTSTKSGVEGTEISGAIGGCAGRGDDGRLTRFDQQTAPHFLIDSAVETNHPGTLVDDLRSVTHIGSAGCGFQQSLAAIRAAFGNDYNRGFVATMPRSRSSSWPTRTTARRSIRRCSRATLRPSVRSPISGACCSGIRVPNPISRRLGHERTASPTPDRPRSKIRPTWSP